jgi:hypothetical protein
MTQADFKRSWGIDAKKSLRYNGIKGVYWYYFSIDVRKSDFMKYDGRCISCNKKQRDWRETDAGHFIPASSSRGMQFIRKNVNMQCKACNGPFANKKATAAGYAYYLNKRYGAGTSDELYEMKDKVMHEWSDEEYAAALKRLGVQRDTSFLDKKTTARLPL